MRIAKPKSWEKEKAELERRGWTVEVLTDGGYWCIRAHRNGKHMGCHGARGAVSVGLHFLLELQETL